MGSFAFAEDGSLPAVECPTSITVQYFRHLRSWYGAVLCVTPSNLLGKCPAVLPPPECTKSSFVAAVAMGKVLIARRRPSVNYLDPSARPVFSSALTEATLASTA